MRNIHCFINNFWLKVISGILLLTVQVHCGIGQEHPKLMFTSDDLKTIKSDKESQSLFSKTLKSTIKRVDREIEYGIKVPVPRDLAGGYTHERHKRNYRTMQQAGLLYQITGDDKYAAYVKDMLMQYAGLFPTLTLHPQEISYARGKLFWQCLNDANWLVYTSQAYDCIYEWLSKKERENIENNLLRPYADFLSIENPQFYNRIHNHSAWGNAAVGMVGLVLNDEELIKRALYGYKQKMPEQGAKDNDGGLVVLPDQVNSGFFAQLDNLFSPDGYYTEGPYYQRYAIYPLMVFAVGLQHCKPELEIFKYRDNLLEKALYALLNLSGPKYAFYPVNDAQKGMSCLSAELVTAIDAVYHFCGNDPELLSIAARQKKVVLDITGFTVSADLLKNKAIPFVKNSIELSDGKNGDEGGIAVLRPDNGDNDFSLVFKYTAQGMGHGHFDKLSFSLYNEGKEVLQDYGAARFVNIEKKSGGGYLPENKSFAKQTIAHNTLVVNQKSNYNGNTRTGSNYHAEKFFFDASSHEIKIASAVDSNAYPGVVMHRTMALIHMDNFPKPLVLDVFKVKSVKKNQYDLPYYYLGQIITSNVEFNSLDTIVKIGSGYGYQHLWKVAEGRPDGAVTHFQWLDNNHFYTISSLLPSNSELILGRIGASDPDFNLRNDPVYIIRNKETDNMTIFSVIESHGKYSPVTEIATNAYSGIEKIEILVDNEEYTAVGIQPVKGDGVVLIVSNKSAGTKASHKLETHGHTYKWTGPYVLIK